MSGPDLEGFKSLPIPGDDSFKIQLSKAQILQVITHGIQVVPVKFWSWTHRDSLNLAWFVYGMATVELLQWAGIW